MDFPERPLEISCMFFFESLAVQIAFISLPCNFIWVSRFFKVFLQVFNKYEKKNFKKSPTFAATMTFTFFSFFSFIWQVDDGEFDWFSAKPKSNRKILLIWAIKLNVPKEHLQFFFTQFRGKISKKKKLRKSSKTNPVDNSSRIYFRSPFQNSPRNSPSDFFRKSFTGTILNISEVLQPVFRICLAV